MNDWFSFRGRISRMRYFLRSLIILILPLFVHLYMLVYLFNEKFKLKELNSENVQPQAVVAPPQEPVVFTYQGFDFTLGMLAFTIIAVLLSLLLTWFLLASQVKRLHDMNLTGWLCLINFIPIIGPLLGFAMWLLLLVIKGTDGPNTFGENPAQLRKAKGIRA